jgi:hypothetical protein
VGDLVFSSWDGKPHSHVGMYAGDNKILVAPSAGKNVQLQTLTTTYMNKVDAVRRVPGVDGYAGPTGQPGGSDGGLIPGLPDPGDLVGAVRGLGSSVAGVGAFADKLMWLTLPTSWTRIVSGGIGLALVLLGILTLTRQALRKQ